MVAVSMEKRGILTFHFDDNPQPWEVRTDMLLLLGDIHVVFWKSKQSRNCVYSFIRDCKCFDALETFCRCMSTMCLILLVNLVSLRRWLLYGSLMLTYHMVRIITRLIHTIVANTVLHSRLYYIMEFVGYRLLCP